LLASGTASGSAGHQGDGEDFARRLTKVRTPWRFSSFHPPGPTIAQVSAATAERARAAKIPLCWIVLWPNFRSWGEPDAPGWQE